MDESVGLYEHRRNAAVKNAKLQHQMKYLYDKKVVNKKSKPDDMVLMWNTRLEDKEKLEIFV